MKKIITSVIILILTYSSNISTPVESYAQISNTAVDLNECGLCFIHKSIKIATRTFRINIPYDTLPVTFNITELPPACYQIKAAYLWWTTSTMSSMNLPTAYVRNPEGKTFQSAAIATGASIPKCWNESLTRGFRADISPAITGNGSYSVNLSSTDFETDGITMMIFYRDLPQRWEGHVLIKDGLISKSNYHDTTQTLQFTEPCGNPTNASAFIIASDIQSNIDTLNVGVGLIMNGDTITYPRRFWNSEVYPTNIGLTQNSAVFGVNIRCNDCYSFQMMGIYYRTNSCNSCINDTVNLRVNIHNLSICMGDSVHLSASGALTYNWSSYPGNFLSSEPDIVVSPKVNTKYIVKGTSTDCQHSQYDTIYVSVLPQLVVNAGPDATVCPEGSEEITSNTIGGTPPYRYKWIPSTGLSSDTVPNPTAKPPGTTMYVLNVTDANGCIGRDTVFINVRSNIKPDLGQDRTVCPGSSVVIGSIPKGGTPPYRFKWKPALGLNRTDSAYVTVTPDQNTKYTIIVTDANGCVGTDSISINISNELTIKSTKEYLTCKGTPVGLSVNITGGTKPYKYKWEPSDSLSGNNIATPMANPNKTTKYFVTITDYNGCTAKDTILVAVLDAPVVNAGRDTTICAGSSVTIGKQLMGGTPPYTYRWSPSAGLNSTDQLFVIASPKITTTYILTVTDSNLCSSYDAIIVNVSDPPKTKIKALTATSICPGDSVLLKAEPLSSKYEYHWSTGETTTDITVRKAGRIYLTIENENHCKTTDSIDIKINAVPDVKIVPNKPPFICRGESIILSAEPQINDYTYLWSNGKTDKDITVSQPGTYILRTASDFGCSSYDTIIVQQADDLHAKIEAGDSNNICGDSVLLRAIPSGKDYLYLWSTGETSQEIIARKSDLYTVKVRFNNTCEGSDSINIIISPKPSVRISGPSSICNGNQEILTTDKEFSSYLWSTGESTRQINISKGGLYEVIISDENGCTASDSIYITDQASKITGINNLDLGKICSGEITSKELIVKNDGVDQSIIKTITLKDNNPVFSLGSYSSSIPAGQELELNVDFSPHQVGYYKDTIIVEFSQPCPALFRVEIKAAATAKTLSSLPVVFGSIGSIVEIPLSLKLLCGESLPNDVSYKTEISTGVSVLNTTEVTQDSGVTVEGIKSLNTIFSIQSTTGTESKKIRGKVMLADKDTIPVIINNFKWNNDLIDNETKDGMIILTGLCRPNISRIELLNAPLLTITPNPVTYDAEIKIQGRETGNVLITIYAIEGIKKQQFVLNKTAWEVSEKINLSSFEAGMYQVIATMGGNVLYDKMVILK